MAQAQRKARVTVVGTSLIRRLLEALDSSTDTRKRLEANFGVSHVAMFVSWLGTGQRSTWCSSNQFIELTPSLCKSSGARSAIICNLTQRSVGRYLRSPHQVQIYN